MLNGKLAEGSPGARSSSKKMMKLMKSNVGIAVRMRRIMYWPIAAVSSLPESVWVVNISPVHHLSIIAEMMHR